MHKTKKCAKKLIKKGKSKENGRTVFPSCRGENADELIEINGFAGFGRGVDRFDDLRNNRGFSARS